jgi:hypothetical protein
MVQIQEQQGGRELFKKCLYAQDDLLNNTPLEAAYIWSFSCQAAIGKSIDVSKLSIRIDCKHLKAGKLFCGTDNSELISALEPDTIKEYNNLPNNVTSFDSHSLADIFFISKYNELVLIEIVDSGRRDNADEKRDKLSNWISENHTKITQQYTL